MNCPTCNTHIDEHPANVCFNAWVAEAIFGDTIWTNGIIWTQYREFEPGKAATIPLKDYTRDIAPAWEVHQKACSWLFSKRRVYFTALQYIVSDREIEGKLPLISWPDVMIFLKPEDFCRAAIKAKLGSTENEDLEKV